MYVSEGVRAPFLDAYVSPDAFMHVPEGGGGGGGDTKTAIFRLFFGFLYFVILKQDYKIQKTFQNFTPVPEKQEYTPVKIAEFTEFHAGGTIFSNFVNNASPSNMGFNE